MCLQPVTKGSWCNDHGRSKKIQFQVAGLQFFTNVTSCMLLSWYQSKPGQHPFPGSSHWQRFRKISRISVISTLGLILMVGCAGKFIAPPLQYVKASRLTIVLFKIKTDVDVLQTCRISFVSLQPISPVPWSQTTSMQAPLVGRNTGWPCFLWSNGRSMTILACIYYRQAEQVCVACTSLQLSISNWAPPLFPFHNVKAKYLRRHQIHDAAYTLYLLWNLHQDSDRGLCEDIKQGDKFLHNCSGR